MNLHPSLSRRNFLKKTLAFSGAALVPYPLTSFAITMPDSLYGRIVGICSQPYKPDNISSNENSAIIEIPLSGEPINYHVIKNYHSGHSLINLPDGSFFCTPYTTGRKSPCLFINKDFTVSGELHAPEGYGFGGHTCLLDDGKTLFGHFNSISRPASGDGIAFLADINTRKIIKTAKTPLIHGHDIILSSDAERVIISDDGTLPMKRSPDALFTDEVIKPALYFFNPETLEIENSIFHGKNGSFVHIDTDDEGSVYGAIEQFILHGDKGFELLESILGKDAENYKNLNLKGDSYSLPAHMLSIDTKTGTIKELPGALSQHTNPFDIRFNRSSSSLINVFIDNNTLARYSLKDQNINYFKTGEWGIAMPFGLTNLGDTPYMAVSGFEKGIAIFDTRDMQLVKFFNQANYGLRHMSFLS